MKIITLFRHAKSSWKDTSLSDHDRPLNKRGKRDVPFMAKRLRERVGAPDLLVVSSAVRTQETAAALKSEFPEVKVVTDKGLYLAPPSNYLALKKNLNDKYNHVVFIGHNPGISSLATHWNAKPVELTTSAFASFQFDANSWSKAKSPDSSIAIDYPKAYYDEDGNGPIDPTN